MADTMRWRYGETKPVVSHEVDSATVIEIGDVVFQDAGDSDRPNPAAAVGAIPGVHANLAAAQEALHDEFLGVAMQRSGAGDTQGVRVATSGVFEFPCASAAFSLGALVGVDDNSGGTALVNQQVVEVATPNLAIGRVAKHYAAATTRVLVEIVGTVSHGGPQAAA